jgi:four helix bundle protein
VEVWLDKRTRLVRRERTSDQLLRSGTSVGAHFREAQRAKSNPDFISKIEGGMQELEETAYWLELLEGARFWERDQLEPLANEADQLMAIFVTIIRKTKAGTSVEDSRDGRVRVTCSSRRIAT